MAAMTPGCVLGERCTALHIDPREHRDYGVSLTIILPGGEYHAVHAHSFPTAQAAHEWAVRQYGRTVTSVLADRSDTGSLPAAHGPVDVEDWLAEYDEPDHYGRPVTGHQVEWWTPHLPHQQVWGSAGTAGSGHVNPDLLCDHTHTAYGLAFYDRYGELLAERGAVAYTPEQATKLAREWVGEESGRMPEDWRISTHDTIIWSVAVDEGAVRYTDATDVSGCHVEPPVEWEDTVDTVTELHYRVVQT